jgi:hypothetical protein
MPEVSFREFLLKSLGGRADEADMEPLDPQPRGEMMPSPGTSGASGATITAEMPVVETSALPAPIPGAAATAQPGGPSRTSAPPSATSTPRTSTLAPGALHPMAPWRIGGAVALTATFGLMGWQVQRLIDDQAWSNTLMWSSVVAGLVAALCVLGWTWVTTANARRLIEPAVRAQIPDPKAAVLTWMAPFAFVGLAVGIVAVLGERIDPGDDQTAAALPLAVAVVALLLAIPLTYRPLHHLAGVVRQVGGYSVRLAQWMWVPVVMALVGVASIVAMRFAGFDEAGTDSADAAGWAPLWVVAVVGIAPAVIVVLLAWRAGSSVEDAIRVAAMRRRAGAALQGAPTKPPRLVASKPRAAKRGPGPDRTTAITLLPGAELLRLVVVTLVAGLALLSVVGAVVTLMLWFDSTETGLLAGDRARTWDTLDALQAASAGVTGALLVAVSTWSFVIVINVRVASGRRRNPLLAAATWPLAAGAVWWIADRWVDEGSIGRVIVGFVAQAAVLLVPFLVLEHSAKAIDARRTPLRIVYVLVVVLLVHVQGLGGLSRLPDSVTTTDIGRLAGYLAIGALILLCTTLAVTEACRSMSRACRHEVDHHNLLVNQRPTTKRTEPAASR